MICIFVQKAEGLNYEGNTWVTRVCYIDVGFNHPTLLAQQRNSHQVIPRRNLTFRIFIHYKILNATRIHTTLTHSPISKPLIS